MKGVKSITTPAAAETPKDSTEDVPSQSPEEIYIDPEREKAALRKFDIWLVPVAFVFLVLSSLDRINVS